MQLNYFFVFWLATATNIQKFPTFENVRGYFFTEPSLFEKATWALESEELLITLEGFYKDESLDIYTHSERLYSTKEAHECLIIERMMWEFSNAAEMFEADEIIQTLSKTLVDLKSKFEEEMSKTSKYFGQHNLTMFHKQNLFELEQEFQTLRLFLLPIFYSPMLQIEHASEVEQCLETAQTISAYLTKSQFPFTPETIKLKALIRTIEIISNWVLGRSMTSHEDDNMQLAFLHSMKISTSRVLSTARAIHLELSRRASHAVGIAQEGEFLTSKFFFLYLSTPLISASTTNQPSLFNIASNPFLAWLFRGICLDLYKILRELRIKSFYVIRSSPSESRNSEIRQENVNNQIQMGKLIQLGLENLAYSKDIYCGACSAHYRQSKYEITTKDADDLLTEFNAWHLEHDMFPDVMLLYNYIQSNS